METNIKHYMVIAEDSNGRDILDSVYNENERHLAEKRYKEFKSDGDCYCRWEEVEVIGGDKENGFEYDNNDTIESYYPEDND